MSFLERINVLCIANINMLLFEFEGERNAPFVKDKHIINYLFINSQGHEINKTNHAPE